MYPPKLTDLYSMTDQYAVFGNPIEHSKSPLIHKLFAEQAHKRLEYKKQLVDTDGFCEAVERFFSDGGKGLNITVPFKLEAFALADEPSERAKKAQAANVLYKKDGLLIGDNTDGAGICSDIVDNLGWPVQGQRVLILGAGGAVRGVLEPILENAPVSIVIANRTVSKAEALADIFKADANRYGCEISTSNFADLHDSFDLVINGTSASLHRRLPPIKEAVVNHARCYDMMYNVGPTAFLQWASRAGACSIADGLGMLVEQAAESFLIWHGVRPETGSVIEKIRAALANR